ncbi:hypothetical protein [Sphingomonas jeddahensis]|uniref:Uncharacterized protein n=1 Tax=Sphingomonas jeddahensis TaxID=1915074 RepID=A0A1V2EX60_9SPHN|nr:hypothetical protein [Sphingomonas jeddahensis]ONF97261.1 hypothetical protein SPHI_06980 [Sphingomonas jeddahensis]
MKRKFVMPSKPQISEGDKQPRERRKLGLRYELVTGDTVSGLR